jgi:hypothetical protein
MPTIKNPSPETEEPLWMAKIIQAQQLTSTKLGCRKASLNAVGFLMKRPHRPAYGHKPSFVHK